MTILQNTSIFDTVDTKNALQKASQSMNSTVSNLKDQAINPLKAISSGIKAGVVKVDETQSVITSTISSYKSQAIDLIQNGLKNLTGGLLNVSDLSNLVTYQDGFKVNTDALLSMASAKVGFNISSVQNLKNQIGDAFTRELDSMTFGLSKGLFMVDTSGKGIKVAIADDWKLTMGQSLIDFLGQDDETGFGSIINVAALNSVLNTMLKQTVQYGMYQGYGNYSSMYLFESDYHDALVDSISISISRGDLASVNTIFNIIQKEGVNKVKALYPDLIETLLSSFTFSSDIVPSDYKEMTTMLLKVCEAVGGVNWYKHPTQFGNLYNMSLVNRISDSAKILLEETDYIVPLLCSAGVFIDQNADEAFKSQFPNAVTF